MLKRILFTLTTLLVIYSGVLVAFRFNEPEHISDENTSAFSANALDYDSLKEYTLSSGSSQIHYYFFCTALSNDCLYLENTVLNSVSNETDWNLSSLIEYVDISSLETDQQLSRLEREWEVSSYPAFLACHIEDRTIIVDNKLEWDSTHPINTEDVKRWLAENGMLDSYETVPPIATPES